MNSRSDKLSVMLAILTLEQAGAQEVVRLLARHLPEQGCSVTVCAFRDGPAHAEIEALGVPVRILGRPRSTVLLLPLFLLELVRIRQELVRLIGTYQVDLLQAHGLQVLDFLVLTLRYTTRLRVVLWTVHNVHFLPRQVPRQPRWIHQAKRSGYRLCYRFFSRYVDGIIAVSDQVRQSVVEQFGPIGDKLFTICNGVDLERFEQAGDKKMLCEQLGIVPQARLIATVGRLTEQKGHRVLLDAAQAVLSSFPDLHLLFVGDGVLRGSLAGQAEQVGVADHVHFLGVRQDVPDLLAAVDLFVLPSLWEGLSMALLEAMAAAKPIVATAVSGTSQAMVSGETGLLVPPGDSRALAEAIVWLLSHPAQADQMGQAARQHVEKHFSARRQALEHWALYQQLLAREGGV